MENLKGVIEAVAGRHAPDPRTIIFDVSVEERDAGIALVGETTSPAAADALREQIAAVAPDIPLLDEIVRLPDPSLGDARFGLVRAAVAPVHGEPRISSAQVSQYVLGHRLDLLSRREMWWRVRGEDGYIGWVHHGYLECGAEEWAREWELGAAGEPVVSLGAELCDEAGRSFIRLPWGARIIRETLGRYRLPDGRRGELCTGELVDADRLVDRFPPWGESVTRTARRWMGTPYLWGGVTPAGADCSGFVQSVLWMHGIALPRDSDQQGRVGALVLEGSESGFDALRPGDLLYFAERPGRITHVAISLGGAQIIHSSLSNGGVAVNDLDGDLPGDRNLRSIFVHARRVLPD